MERNEENLISTGAGIAAHCTHPVTPEHYLFTCFEKKKKDLNFIRFLLDFFWMHSFIVCKSFYSSPSH